jgi:hypothetical protein
MSGEYKLSWGWKCLPEAMIHVTCRYESSTFRANANPGLEDDMHEYSVSFNFLWSAVNSCKLPVSDRWQKQLNEVEEIVRL